jgi:predicted cobalt transporter CbtA
MIGTFVKRGAISGLAGGGALAVALRLLGEDSIGRAIAIDARLNPAPPGSHDMFSRTTQQIGGMIGALIFGVALGVVFAVVMALVRHRMAGPGDARRAVTLAAVAFVTVALVPFLKYPANPPGVGEPDTITRRTLLYVVMLTWSVVSTWAAWRAFRWLRARGRPDIERAAGTVAVYAGLITTGFVLLPPVTGGVILPAQLLWRFRLATITGQAAFWAVTGLTFGWLATRKTQTQAQTQMESATATPSEPVVSGRG